MYISFSDAPGDGIGGAAQGIIPVQDEHGNMLGGSAPVSPTRFANEVKMEAQSVKTEVHKLEEYFEKMMAAVERNTAKVADLTEKRGHRYRTSHDETLDALSLASGRSADSGPTDMGMLAGHFVRMNDLLAKNAQHVETLTKKHYENETKLSQALEALTSKQINNASNLDRLSSHLDRIQGMMEATVQERKDSARELPDQQRPVQIDFSPLTERLEKVQEAVEQNSALVQRIHDAIEQQNEHTKALVGLASRNGGEKEADSERPMASLAPLNEHLEQIYNAIEEGNKHAKEHAKAPHKLDLKPLARHLEALHTHSAANVDSMNRLIDSQDATRDAIVANGGEIDFTPMTEYLDAIKQSSDTHNESIKKLLRSQEGTRKAIEANGGEIDFTPMTEYLEAIRASSDTQNETIRELIASQEATRKESIVDFTPLNEHLSAVRTATETNSDHIKSLVESHKASTKAARSPSLDFTPLTERLNRIHTVLEKQAERGTSHSEGIGDTKFIMSALTSHLSKIQGVTEQNAQHVRALHDKQDSTGDRMQNAVSETSEQIQSLIQRNKEQEARIDAQNSQLRELMSGQREVVDVMRQLAKSVIAQNKGSCDHIVVPPPRKMGRKVVGFVYDAKEGHIDDRPRGPERSVTSSRSRTPERPAGPERRFTTSV